MSARHQEVDDCYLRQAMSRRGEEPARIRANIGMLDRMITRSKRVARKTARSGHLGVVHVGAEQAPRACPCLRRNGQERSGARLHAVLPASLGHRRFRKNLLLEIGVLEGDSLAIWRDYLPRSAVIGIDIAATTIDLGRRVRVFQAPSHLPRARASDSCKVSSTPCNQRTRHSDCGRDGRHRRRRFPG
jgi:hypothetical protein